MSASPKVVEFKLLNIDLTPLKKVFAHFYLYAKLYGIDIRPLSAAEPAQSKYRFTVTNDEKPYATMHKCQVLS